METWSIHLHKEYFKFSCAHFLIFPDGSKERLHGHNYRAEVEIEGKLSDEGMVIDFNHAKPIIRDLCDGLDEHWLLPGQHPELKIEHRSDQHTEVTYRDAKYLAPTDEVIVLPIGNTSVENIASWFSRSLMSRLIDELGGGQIGRLRVAIEETSGQLGVHEINSPLT